ncbi:MAG: GSCFA domain-containing protein [Bacteroidota bacterium]
MKTFRTEIIIPRKNISFHHENKILLSGSCFTENIGNKLKEGKFQVDINPFGVVYNPSSVADGINMLIDQKVFQENELNFSNGLWYSYDHHGIFSSSIKEKCLEGINKRILFSSGYLKETRTIIITFGTAWIYKLKETGKVAANCHKTSPNFFDRVLLTVEEIVSIYTKLLKRLKVVNNEIDFIFTVSPVRHWKDGATANQVSKSILILAIHELKKIFPGIEYFPSYEIVIDDLRDYRFYNEDMVHPNNQAIDYIYEKFLSAYTGQNTRKIISRVEKFSKAKKHKPFNPETIEYKSFCRKQLDEINLLLKEYPYLNFEEEIHYFKSYL